jgi:hypothetical protein
MASFSIRLWAAILMAMAVSGCQNTAGSSSRQAALSAQNVTVESAQGSDEEAGERYFIEFRSRRALSYGHSFVVFGRRDSKGRVLEQEVAGLAPKSDDPNVYMAAHLVPVESSVGWTDGDLEKEYMSAFWRVPLNEPEYRRVVAKIRDLQASRPVWHAVIYNCNSFVGDIARSMGYKAPFHLLAPRQYIDQLRRMNGGKNADGWTAPSAANAAGSSARQVR